MKKSTRDALIMGGAAGCLGWTILKKYKTGEALLSNAKKVLKSARRKVIEVVEESGKEVIESIKEAEVKEE